VTLPPAARKLLLLVHVAVSVGWLGAALAYLALVTAALARGDAPLERATFLALEPLTWFALVPLALAALVTGVVQGIGTRWGLLRHYWVVFKLLLTSVATLVLLLNAQTVDELADLARAGRMHGGLGGQLLHAAIGTAILAVTLVLALYKPRGVTPWGRRKGAA